MTTRTGIGLFAAAVLLLSLDGRAVPAAAPVPAARATCVFTNPAYAGKCTQSAEVPKGSTEQQACEAILRCLNDVGCLKTYCDATTIRSGWKLESARPAGAAK